jgi:hypothetical protein
MTDGKLLNAKKFFLDFLSKFCIIRKLEGAKIEKKDFKRRDLSFPGADALGKV